jgi:signal transduction histidine kinase
VLISSTLIAGGLVFALWRKHHLAKVVELAEERRLAERKRREAEAQAQQKSRQLATMSHEIRTPLNGVIGMLGLMLETELSAEQKNYAGIAHGSARSLLSFLDEILDTAKGEALAASRSGPFELQTFIESITELMAPRAHAKGIDLSALVQPGMPAMLDIDQQKLRQILFNLVGNAIKFTDAGEVVIKAGAGNGNGSFELSVRDTGPGISAADQAKLFQEFQQVENPKTRKKEGTGLGLAISKRIVEMHGGRIWIKKKANPGTTVSFTIPIVPTHIPVIDPGKV